MAHSPAPERPEKALFGAFLERHKGSKLVISSHRKADVDSLACSYALHRFFPNSVIALDDIDENAKALIEKLGMKVSVLRELDPRSYDGLVVVDTSAYTLLEPAKSWKILLIIDHHHAQGRDMKADAMIVDESSPSTAEIIVSLLPSVDKDTAFALACAVISDTARFKSGRRETFETLAKLMGICGSTYHELLGIAEPEARPDVKIAILKACQRVGITYAGGLVIATSEVSSNESDAAQVLSEAADVAFVASWKDRERETRISARARKSVPIELNEVMKEVGVSLGGNGGGHPKAAGATVKAHSQDALKVCVEVLTAKLESKD